MIDQDRPAILLTGPVMENVVERQLASRFRLVSLADLTEEDAARIPAVATRGAVRVDDAFMARLPALRIVANFGVGYDTVDAAAAAARGVVVTNTPDVLDDEVADLTLGLLLATVREIPRAERFLRAGRWKEGAFPLGATLRGRRVGLLGMGRIGRAITRRLEGFGVEIAYHTRSPRADVPWPWFERLVDLARAVDILVVIVPGGPATRNMVNAEVLSALGPDGILINVARGTVVDEPALLKALQERTILAAGLDVFAREPDVPEGFLALENAVLLPHVGSSTHYTRGAMGQLVVDNLVSVLDGKGPLTPVAETPWPLAAARG